MPGFAPCRPLRPVRDAYGEPVTTSEGPYRRAVLVFNPHSTGGAERTAHALAGELACSAPGLTVDLVATEYAGHAREIAAKAARAADTLVVSVSGDGGYGEVVSGVMDATGGGRTDTVVAVAAAGNANDHRRETRRRPLHEAIAAARPERLDLLRLDVDGERPRWAHSYVGLGITPAVALELEKGGKGSFREIATTVREFARFRPFSIVLEDGRRRRFDSLVLANVASMAKYATISEGGDPRDGVFEVVTIPHVGKLRMLAVAVRAAVRGLGRQPTARRYAFTTTAPTPLQLDGEVVELGPDRHVVVEIAPGAVLTVR